MKMVNAVQLIERENGNFDVINYHRPTDIIENGEVIRTSYVVAYNFPKQMALEELARHEQRAIRTHGTYLVEEKL